MHWWTPRPGGRRHAAEAAIRPLATWTLNASAAAPCPHHFADSNNTRNSFSTLTFFFYATASVHLVVDVEGARGDKRDSAAKGASERLTSQCAVWLPRCAVGCQKVAVRGFAEANPRFSCSSCARAPPEHGSSASTNGDTFAQAPRYRWEELADPVFAQVLLLFRAHAQKMLLATARQTVEHREYSR